MEYYKATSARSTSYWHNENPPQTSWFIFEKAQEEFKILCFLKKEEILLSIHFIHLGLEHH